MRTLYFCLLTTLVFGLFGEPVFGQSSDSQRSTIPADLWVHKSLEMYGQVKYPPGKDFGPSAIESGFAKHWGDVGQICWDFYGVRALPNQVARIIETAEKIEILVRYDRDNPYHISKKKKQETRREYLNIWGNQVEYWRYLLPTVELNIEEQSLFQELLLKRSPYFSTIRGPRLSGLIIGHRHVLRVSGPEGEVLFSITRGNIPSLRITGKSKILCRGLLYPESQIQWLDMIEAAIGKAGYD